MAVTSSPSVLKTVPAGESERQSTTELHYIANALLPAQRRTDWVGDYIAAFLYYHDKEPHIHICLLRRRCKLKAGWMDVLLIYCWGVHCSKEWPRFNRLHEYWQRVQGHILLGLVSDARRGFNVCSLSACGCLWHSCHGKAYSPLQKATRKCQKVLYCHTPISKRFPLVPESWHFGDKRCPPAATMQVFQSASGRRKPVLLLIRATTRLSENTGRMRSDAEIAAAAWSLRLYLRLKRRLLPWATWAAVHCEMA